MTVRIFLLSLSVTFGSLLGLVGCGSVDEHVEEWCFLDANCVCDDEGLNCCITETGSCYDGQCCDGLVCNEDGRCVAK